MLFGPNDSLGIHAPIHFWDEAVGDLLAQLGFLQGVSR